jgi:hypothetical protein
MMGDKKGQEFNFDVTYSVRDGKPVVTATSMVPNPSGDDTSIDDEGNIVLDKKNTAFVNFSCDTPNWSISQLQIKGKNDWGEALGNNAQKDFPHADKDTGNVPPDDDGNYVLWDRNEKSNTVEYRVQVTQAGGASAWADPRVRSIGD